MKRIDDKIKEIEKKDKNYRIVFIVVIALVAAWYVFVTQRTISDQEKKLEVQIVELKKTNTALETEKNEKATALAKLEESLDSDKYWKLIEKENTIEGYISYLTNNWGIKRTEIPAAIKKVLDKDTKLDGWLYVGLRSSSDVYSSKDIVEIVWRDGEESNIANELPKINDIVKLKTLIERFTYTHTSLSPNYRNKDGWRPKSRGFVTAVFQDGAELKIKIKYY